MTPTRPIQSPLLVGRDGQLQLADQRIAETAAGRGHSLLVAGDAGIGKSRLLQATLRKAAAAGFRIAQGDLAPNDVLVPLASVSDLARTLSQDAAFGSLGGDLLALERRRGADALGHRRYLVHDIADLVIEAVDRPTLLAFDDLQWGDELSLEVIGELARRSRDLPLLIVAGYRLSELPTGSIQREWRSRLLSQRLAEEIRLEPLTRDETALVTTLILGTGLPAPRDVVAAVYERTDGIPLHIEELLAVLTDEERLDGQRIRDAHVPDTIEDAVLARYRRLSPDAQALARAGAVIGRCFLPDLAAGLLDRPLIELDAPLQELVEESFLYPFSFNDRGYYDFRHQLLRDALYGAVQAGELRRLHARVGEFAGVDEQATIHASVHFERAGLRSQAYRTALAGASAASALSSRHEAFELYRRAVANAPTDLSPRDLGLLYRGYADAASATDDSETIIRAAQTAREHLLAAGESELATDMLLYESVILNRNGASYADRDALLSRISAELASLPPSLAVTIMHSDIHMFRALAALDVPRLDQADESLQAARKVLATIDDEVAAANPDVAAYRADIEYFQGWLDVLQGRVSEGLATTLAVARAARESRFESTGVTAYRNVALLGVRVMRYDAVRVGLEEGLRYADEIEQSFCRHMMASLSAHMLWAEGRGDEARQAAGVQLGERASQRAELAALDSLGYVAMGRGELSAARDVLGRSLAAGLPTGNAMLILPARWGLAETALQEGTVDEAIEHCGAAAAFAESTDERALLVPFVVTGTRALLAARRPDEAERWVQRMTSLLSTWPEQAGPALQHADGLVRTASGATVTARASLESAVAGWDRLGRTWEGLWARLDLASCLLRSNRDGEAIPVVRSVAERAADLGSVPVRARADELLAIARSRGAEEEPWRPLTAREFEVARLVADGMTNNAIGEQLRLSPRTVGAHVEHILAKLGFTRRAEIAAWVGAMAVPAGSVTG